MPDGQDKLSAFYNVLKQDNTYKDVIKDEVSFRSTMMNPSKSAKLFEVLKQDETYKGVLKDYNQFTGSLGLTKYNALPQLPGAMTAPDNSARENVDKPTPLTQKGKTGYIAPVQKEQPLDFNQQMMKVQTEVNTDEKTKQAAKDKVDSEAKLNSKADDHSWGNWFSQFGGATTKTLFDSVSGVANVLRDNNILPGMVKSNIYNEDGKLNEYGSKLHEAGFGAYFNDPLAKLIVDVDGVSAQTDKHMQNHNLPDTFMGRGMQGVAHIGSDILISSAFPETKIAEGGSIALRYAKQFVVNPFTKYLVAKTALTGAKEAGQKNENVALEAVKGAGEGGLEAGKIFALGAISGKFGGKLVTGVEKLGLVTKAGLPTHAAARVASEIIVWGGEGIVSGVARGEGVKLKNSESGVFIGAVFGLKGAGEHAIHDIKSNYDIKTNVGRTYKVSEANKPALINKYTEDVMRNFFGAHPDAIKEIHDSKMTADELDLKTVEVAKKAIDEKDSEKKEQISTEGRLLRKMSDIQFSINSIQSAKSEWVDMVNNNEKLTPEQKQEMLDHIELADQLGTKNKAKFEAEKENGKHQEDNTVQNDEVSSKKSGKEKTGIKSETQNGEQQVGQENGQKVQAERGQQEGGENGQDGLQVPKEEVKPIELSAPKDFEDWTSQIEKRLANGEDVEVEKLTTTGNRKTVGISGINEKGELMDEHGDTIGKDSVVEPVYANEVKPEAVTPEVKPEEKIKKEKKAKKNKEEKVETPEVVVDTPKVPEAEVKKEEAQNEEKQTKPESEPAVIAAKDGGVKKTEAPKEPEPVISEKILEETSEDKLQNKESSDLYKLSEEVNRARNSMSNATDTEGAIKDYTDAVKEKKDYEEAVANRKKTRKEKIDLKSLIEDEILASQDKSRNYQYREAFDKDPRLAALEEAKSLLDFTESGDLKEAYIKQGQSEEEATKNIEKTIERDKRDIRLLEESLAKDPVKEAPKTEVKVEAKPEPKPEVIEETQVKTDDVTTSKEETFNNIMRGRKRRNPVDLKDKTVKENLAKNQVKFMTDLELLRKYAKEGNNQNLVKKFKGMVKRLYDEQSKGLLPTESSKGHPTTSKTTGHFEKSAEGILINSGISRAEVSKFNKEARMELAKEIDTNEYNGKYFSDKKEEEVTKPKTEDTGDKNESGSTTEGKTDTEKRTVDEGNKTTDEPVKPKEDAIPEPPKTNGDKVVDDPEVIKKAEQDLEALKATSKDNKQLKHQKSTDRLIVAKREGKISRETFDDFLEKFNDVLPEQTGKLQKVEVDLEKLYKEFRKEQTINAGINPKKVFIAVQIVFKEAQRLGIKIFKSLPEFKKFLKQLNKINLFHGDLYNEISKHHEVIFGQVNSNLNLENIKSKGSIVADYNAKYQAGNERINKEKKTDLIGAFKKEFVYHAGKLMSLAKAEASFKLGDLPISPTAFHEFKKALDNKAGVSAQVAQKFDKAREGILGELMSSDNPLLSNKHQDLLAQIVDLKSTIELDQNRDDNLKERLKHSHGLTKETAQEVLDAIMNKDADAVKEYGDYDAKDLEGKSQKYFDYMHDLLKMRHDAGLINDAAFKVLDAVKYYSPRSYVEHLDMNGRGGATGGADVAGIGALKGGSIGDKVTNISKLMQDGTELVTGKIARNNQDRAFWEMFGEDGLSFAQKAPLTKQYIKDVALESQRKKDIEANGGTYDFKYVKPEYVKTPKGMKEVNFINKDAKPMRFWIKEELHNELGAIPKLFGSLDSKVVDAIKFFAGAGLTRTLATSSNPEFTLTNAVRDMAFIYLTTDHYSSIAPVFAGQIIKDMWNVGGDAFLRKGRFNKLIEQHGAREYISGREIKSTSGGYDGKHVIWNKAKNALLYLAESSELLTRLALRERVINNKLELMKKANEVVTPEARKQIESDASYEAANYIDFSQGGRTSKALNQWIPFFNASIQGTRKTFESVARDPKLFAVKATQLMMTSMLGYYYNNSDDKKSKFYQTQVPEYEKSNYYIFMSPFSHIDEADGVEKYRYYKIPKSQDQMVLGTIGDAFTNTLLHEITGEQKYEDNHILNTDRVVSSIKGLISLIPDAGMLPPVLKGMIAYYWNYDTFRQTNLYKGQKVRAGLESDKHTMKFLKEAGIFEDEHNFKIPVSPARLQGAFKTMVPTKNIWFDALGALGSIGADLTKSTQDIAEEKTGFRPEKFIGLRRFVGQTEDRPDYKGIEDANINANSDRKLRTYKVDEAYTKYKKGDMTIDDSRKLIKEVANGDAVERDRLMDNFMKDRDNDRRGDRSPLSAVKGLFTTSDASSQYFFKQWQKMNDDDKKQLVTDLKRAEIYNEDFGYKWRKLKEKAGINLQ